MADRDWERELAEIDRRLGAVPDAPPARDAGRDVGRPAAAREPAPQGGARTPPSPAPVAPADPPRRTLGTPAPAGRRSWRAQFALLFWLALGVAVVAALISWPYPSRCGAGLGYYLALVGALGAAGLATSVSAWRHRAPFVHLLGLAMITGAAVLAARDLLPRVGYAVPTAEHPASWSCPVDPAGGVAPSPGQPAAPAAAPAAPSAQATPGS